MLTSLFDPTITIGLVISVGLFMWMRLSQSFRYPVFESVSYVYITILMLLSECLQYIMFGEYMEVTSVVNRCAIASIVTLSCFIVASIHNIKRLSYGNKNKFITLELEKRISKINNSITVLKSSIAEKVSNVQKATHLNVDETRHLRSRIEKSEQDMSTLVAHITQALQIVEKMHEDIISLKTPKQESYPLTNNRMKLQRKI